MPCKYLSDSEARRNWDSGFEFLCSSYLSPLTGAGISTLYLLIKRYRLLRRRRAFPSVFLDKYLKNDYYYANINIKSTNPIDFIF